MIGRDSEGFDARSSLTGVPDVAHRVEVVDEDLLVPAGVHRRLRDRPALRTTSPEARWEGKPEEPAGIEEEQQKAAGAETTERKHHEADHREQSTEILRYLLRPRMAAPRADREVEIAKDRQTANQGERRSDDEAYPVHASSPSAGLRLLSRGTAGGHLDWRLGGLEELRAVPAQAAARQRPVPTSKAPLVMVSGVVAGLPSRGCNVALKVPFTRAAL